MKYRPSKGFILTMLPLVTLVVSFGFGLLPQMEEFEAKAHPIPGEITFRHPTPQPRDRTTTVSLGKNSPFKWSKDWLEEGYENLMKWEYNPWKRDFPGFGGHLSSLVNSKDPADRAKLREIHRLAEAWHRKLMERFPELAVNMKSVPDDQNGFLKFLDLLDRYKAASPDGQPKIDYPKALDDYINQDGPWDAAAAKAWLAQQKSLVDEIRAIGLMTEQSVNGIPIDRWGFISGRFPKNCTDILAMEARVAAEQGDVAAALEAVRASTGLADHFDGVETPSLLWTTVTILLRLNLQSHVMRDIIPALPPGQFDPAEWEQALNPTVSAPSDFARLMRGEWSVGSRYLLLPMLLDPGETSGPADSGNLLDYYSQTFVDIVQSHESATLGELPTLEIPPLRDNSDLSRLSRQLTEILSVGMASWRKGWDRSQSQFAMTQAAFAIMQGQPIPRDPIFGAEYRWDPATRQLSFPAGEFFDRFNEKPITVPKP